MKGLSLFSGAGIGELAFKQIFPDYRTIGYVEWDKYCQEVLRARIRDGVIDDAPIFGDIRQFNERYASLYIDKVDWLSGGFPCQPFSVAGNRAGEADERNMWPATRDAIRIIRPRYVFLENVPGLLAHEYIKRVFGDLAEMRYDCEWDVVGAGSCGALHKRARWWCLAYAGGYPVVINREPDGSSPNNRGTQNSHEGNSGERFPLDQPIILRTAHGVASQVDRLKALGNGWVIQVVASILQVTNQEE